MRRLRPHVVAVALCLAAGPALAQDDEVLAALERRTAEIARDAAPSVVGITAVTEPPQGPQLVLPGLTFAPMARERERIEANGFVVDAGIIATTFEIARESARFEVRFADGTSREARLLGRDEPFRVAVLRIDPHAFARPLSGAPDEVEPGSRTLAWLVSAARRGEPETLLATVRPATCDDSSYDRWLAAWITLREGSGGSPLLARDGRLLGMAVGCVGERSDVPTTGARARSTLFVRGSDVIAAAREIAQAGRVRRPRLGVLLEGRTNRVDQLVPGGPAEKAGVRDGDRVVQVAGTDVASAAQITRALVRRAAGETVSVKVARESGPVALSVVLDETVLPVAPVEPPLPGAILEVAAKEHAQTVTVTAVETASPFGAAGLLVGDEVVQIDGLDVLRFLARHRVRPATAPPSTLLVRRDGRDLALTASPR